MRAYGYLFLLSMRQAIKGWKSLVGRAMFLIACMIVFAHLWKAMAIQGDYGVLLWYIAMNQWLILSFVRVETRMEGDLRDGKIAYLLLRPISYIGAVFFESLGGFIVNLTAMAPVAGLFTWASVGWISLTWSMIGATVLAGVLAILCQMLIGLSAFWLREVDPLYWLWEKCLFVFGGLLFPLTMYPETAKAIALWTPFPYILGQRTFGGLFVWIGIASILLWIIYRKGLKIIQMEGG